MNVSVEWLGEFAHVHKFSYKCISAGWEIGERPLTSSCLKLRTLMNAIDCEHSIIVSATAKEENGDHGAKVASVPPSLSKELRLSPTA